MVLTSNRTRELHDALKRRCLYHWIDYPDPEREAEIVRARLPGVPDAVAVRVCAAVARLRDEELYKLPGVGETITWARALLALDPDDPLDETLGVALKVREDIERVRERGSWTVPDEAWAPSVTPQRLGRLAAHMRAAGAHVGLGELLAAHRALAAVDAASREDAYLALRAALCSSRADLAVFAAAFDAVFAAPERRAARTRSRRWAKARRWRSRASACPTTAPRPVSLDLVPVPAAWSEEELLRHKDFASFTDAERAATRRLLARLARRGPTRLSRRTRRTRRRRDVHDLRATLRALAAPRRRVRRAPLPRAGRAPAPARARVRRLGLDGAVRADAAAVPAGGGRRARARRGVRVRHAADARDARALGPRPRPRAAARRRRGPGLVGRHPHRRGAGRAQPRARPPHRPRRARRRALRRLGPRRPGRSWRRRWRGCSAARTAIVWLNPLAADPRYEPLTRGMQAALPHVDRLLPGNSIASLEALAALMEEGVPA